MNDSPLRRCPWCRDYRLRHTTEQWAEHMKRAWQWATRWAKEEPHDG